MTFSSILLGFLVLIISCNTKDAEKKGSSKDSLGEHTNRIKKYDLLARFIRKPSSSVDCGSSGWGGQLYFIAGQEKPFIKGTDWVS